MMIFSSQLGGYINCKASEKSGHVCSCIAICAGYWQLYLGVKNEDTNGLCLSATMAPESQSWLL